MKRFVTAVAAISLVAGACGSSSSSDPTGDDTADSTTEATSTDGDVSGDDSEEAPDDSEEAPVVEPSADEPVVDVGEDDDDDDVAGGPEIRSISDVPSACRDAMGDWLRTIEPLVSPIDWDGATMADFEEIAIEFETMSDEFESAISGTGCDDLNFVDDSEGDILIEFARSEAPGAVGFLEFLNQMRLGVQPGDDGTLATGDIETCEDAINFLQGLMDDYDSIENVPASELVKVPAITSLFASCTPDQLEFFNGADLEAFMNG